MQSTLTIPDAMAHSLDLEGPGQERQALEMLALEGYRSGKLSRGQVGEALGMGFHETEQFLFDHNAFLHITAGEVKEDADYLRKLLAR